MKTSKHSSPYANRLVMFRRPTKAARTWALAALLSAASLSFSAFDAQAANYYWDGTTTVVDGISEGSSGTWSTTVAAWDTGSGSEAVWATGNTAIFGNGTTSGGAGTVTGGTVTLGTPISALELEFLSTGYTIAPSATNILSLTSTGTGTASAIYTNGSGETENVGGTLNFTAASGATSTVTTGTGDTLNLTGAILSSSGANDGLTFTGSGTVNFTGTTGTTAATTVGKFNVTGGTFSVNTGGTLNLISQTYVGVNAAGTAPLFKVAGGTVNGSAVNLFLGNGTGNLGAFNITSGTTSFAIVTVGAGYNGGGTSSANGANDSTGTFTQSGGTFTAGTNVYVGSTFSGVGTLNLNGGTFNNGGAFARGTGLSGTGGKSTINFNGTQVNLTGAANTAEIPAGFTLNVGTGGALVSTTNNQTFLSSLVSGATTDGGLVKSGAGTLTLSVANTYNGTTAVTAGALFPQSPAALPSYTTSGLTTVASGATLELHTNAGTVTTGFSSANIDTVLANTTFASKTAVLGLETANGSFTYGSNITGNLAVTKYGSGGRLILSGNNTFTGNYTITGGQTAVGSDTALGAGTLAFTTSAPVIESADANTRTISNPINAASVGTFNFGESGNTTYTGALIFNSTTPISVGGSAASRSFAVYVPTTISSGIGANPGFTSLKSGPATLTFNGASGVAGLVGTFTLGNNSGVTRLGSTTALGGLGITIGQASSVATDNEQLQLTGGITPANTVTFAAASSRNDPTAATNPGVAQIDNLSGNNTLSSTATGGYAIPAPAATLANTGTGATGVIFQSDADTLTVSGPLGGNTVSGTQQNYFLAGAGNGVINGVISDGAGVTGVGKSGAGTWTLTAANTYSGTTTVNNGTLLAGNAMALGTGSATINSGGNLNVRDTSTTTPAVGALTLGNNANLTLNSGGALTMTLTSTGTSDNIAFSGTGTLTLSGALMLNTTDSINYGDTYQLFSGAASITENNTFTITGYDTADYTASLDNTTGILSFTATAVPEPATYLGGLLMVGAVGWGLRGRFGRRAHA